MARKDHDIRNRQGNRPGWGLKLLNIAMTAERRNMIWMVFARQEIQYKSRGQKHQFWPVSDNALVAALPTPKSSPMHFRVCGAFFLIIFFCFVLIFSIFNIKNDSAANLWFTALFLNFWFGPEFSFSSLFFYDILYI